MASVFDYVFNIVGNFIAQINGMSAATGEFSAQVDGAQNAVQTFTAACMTFDYAKNVAKSLAEGFTELSSAGVKLDAQMHDLSAVAGVTGEGLKQIETFARQSAKAFGTDCIQTTSKLDTICNISKKLTEINKYHYDNYNDNEINLISIIFAGNKKFDSKIINENNRYFDNNKFFNTEKYNYKLFKENHLKNVYTIFNKKFNNFTENIVNYNFFDFKNIINEILENNNNKNKNNTCFSTFIIYGNPIVKLGDHVSNFAENLIENFNYKTVNYSEELNSLEIPSYSTNLILNTPNFCKIINQYEINEGVNNNINISNITRDFSIGTIEPFIEKQKKMNRKKEKNTEREKIIIEKEESKEISRPEISREDIESVVIDMFRREVELCSY
ncbi:MAG: hypothetical protein HDS16_01120 [Bacteroides sp.]|nr:hypothetical protein [Bacteroidales bacterium]MBD5301594.1 hypothetical protein [Bacteroides sp.]